MKTSFQAGIIVEDFDAAMAELTAMLGVRWSGPIQRDDIWPGFRMAQTIDGPLHIELCCGPAGSPWDPAGGPRLDHLGFWTDDIEEDKKELEKVPSVELELGGLAGIPFAYYRGTASGLKAEIVDASLKPVWRDRWGMVGY
jgi:hypothetical protein